MVVNFLKKHFGGIPKSFSDLAWIIRVNPNSAVSLPKAGEYRVTAPGSQPDYVAPHQPKYHNFRYFTRDTRRNFPQTVSSEELPPANLLPTASTTEGKAVTTTSDFPPIIDNRYTYSDSHAIPKDDGNPDFANMKLVK